MGGDGKSKLSKYITGMANFSSQYNFQCIALVLLVMSVRECTTNDDGCKDGDQAEWVDSTASAAVFIGAVVGQLTMGYLGDLFSRNLALCWTLIIAGVSSILTAVASVGGPNEVYAIIIAFRFTLGVGLGGVYPLAATKASEDGAKLLHKDAPPDSQAAGWSFFWQLPGLFVPWLFGYILSFSTTLSTSSRWRLILGLGSIPSFITVFLLLLESYYENGNMTAILVHEKRYSISEAVEPATHIFEVMREDDNGRKLFVCGSTWLLFDIVMYGIGLITGHIISQISDDDNVSNNESIRHLSSKQMIASSVTIVVALFSIYLISIIGLKRLQYISFGIVTFFCLLLACLFEYLNHYNPDALFGLYCITYASLNFGLGATTYAYPAAVFPKKIRSTFNGMASACGKIGAVIGAFTFIYISNSDVGYSGLLGICAFIAILGGYITYAFTYPGDIKDVWSEKMRETTARLNETDSSHDKAQFNPLM
eukprot:gene13221-14513_t